MSRKILKVLLITFIIFSHQIKSLKKIFVYIKMLSIRPLKA